MSGILLGHVLEGPPPEVVAVGQDVGLGHERELLLLVALAGELEGPADAALAALAGVDGRLRGDLVGRALLQPAADAGVHVFGVLADDDEIDVARPLAGQRGLDAGEELDGPEIDVLVEAETQGQEQALFQHAGGDVGMAHGAQEDGLEGGQFVDDILGQDLAGAEESLAAEIEILEFVANAFQGRDGLEDLDGFGGDFRAGPVAAHHGDTKNVVAAHDSDPRRS